MMKHDQLRRMIDESLLGGQEWCVHNLLNGVKMEKRFPALLNLARHNCRKYAQMQFADVPENH